MCMAVYAVPIGSSKHVDVDRCWKGPHITLAGFHRYDHVPGGRRVDAHGRAHYHLGRHLDTVAEVRPQGQEWHVTEHNRTLRAHHLAVQSDTLHEVVHGLARLGFSDLKPSAHQTLGLHVSFDRDACPRGSPCETSALREFASEGWRLYPVLLENCRHFDARTQCPSSESLHYCHDHVSHPIRS